MAPARTRELSTEATPRKMSSPRPPAPMAAAMVATPTQVTVAVRRPARMTRCGHGEFELGEALAVGHAEGVGYVDQRGVDGADAGVGVAQDGKQGVGGERDDGDAGGAVAEPGSGQEEAEHRERGDGLQDVGEADDGPGPARRGG